MGVGYKKTSTIGDIPVWQGYGKDIQLAQGGFVLDLTGLAAGFTLKAGTPMNFDELTRVAKVIKTATINAVAGGSATTYQVKKGHGLIVGDYFAKTVGGAAYAITAIDTTNAAYDVVTVGTTIGAAAVGDTVFVSSATGASAAAFSNPPKGLLYADTRAFSGESVSVVIRGTVYARRVPYSANLESALPKIIYSQSY